MHLELKDNEWSLEAGLLLGLFHNLFNFPFRILLQLGYDLKIHQTKFLRAEKGNG
jgi:hypothetical protein